MNFKFFRKWKQERILRGYMPNPIIDNDIFLVSYPKSGNTWVRFLIANAIRGHYSIKRTVNFFNIVEAIPDVQVNKRLSLLGPFGLTELPRIIKSHSPYNPYYRRVIFIARDPRDVLVSHYHYLRSFKVIPPEWSFSKFIKNPRYGPLAWVKYTDDWLQYTSRSQGKNIQLFLYEDFLKEPHAQLSRIMELFGLDIADDVLDKAIQLSSADYMRTLDKSTRSTVILKNQETPFVRKAKAGEGKKLSQEDREYIEDVTRESARALGYQY